MINRIKDVIHLFRALTLYKVFNAAWVGLHFVISKRNKWNRHHGLPISMSVEPTTACNLGCPECPSGLKKFSRPTGNIKMHDFEKWMSEWSRHIIYLNFYFQGEPFIHPQIIAMIKRAHQKKVYTSVSTNGHFLQDTMVSKIIESGLDRIIISMDGFSQEVYEQYRVHGDVKQVMEGVSRLVSARRKARTSRPYIILQTLVVKPNESELNDIRKWALGIGADEVKWKTAQLYEPSGDHPLMPTQDKYRRYRENESGEWVIKNQLEDHCWRLWSSCVVTRDGRVVPCCFDKDASYDMGNLHNHRLTEIWQNELYMSFREKVLTSRKQVDICSNCSEGTRVWT